MQTWPCLNLIAARRTAGLLATALAFTVAGCRSPEPDPMAEAHAEFKQTRTEMVRAMRAAGATGEQIRQAEASLDAAERQMRNAEKQMERLEKAED